MYPWCLASAASPRGTVKPASASAYAWYFKFWGNYASTCRILEKTTGRKTESDESLRKTTTPMQTLGFTVDLRSFRRVDVWHNTSWIENIPQGSNRHRHTENHLVARDQHNAVLCPTFQMNELAQHIRFKKRPLGFTYLHIRYPIR